MSSEMKMLLDKLDILIKKVDILTKVTAASVFQGKQLTESVSVLLNLGFESKEIAKILGTKSNIVRAIKSQMTNKPKTKKKRIENQKEIKNDES